MRALILSLAVLSLTSQSAMAIEHTILRWKKTGQCEVVVDVPRWGDHFVALGHYNSRFEAERALSQLRRTEGCPASKSAKSVEDREKPKKKAPTYREDVERQGIFIP